MYVSNSQYVSKLSELVLAALQHWWQPGATSDGGETRVGMRQGERRSSCFPLIDCMLYRDSSLTVFERL